MISRRAFLMAAGAAAIAPALPTLPLEQAVTAPAAEPLLAFAAGTEGEFDWQPFFGRTVEEARNQALRYFGYDDDEGPPYYFEFQRVEAWDHRGSPDAVTGADWIRADMGYCCSRCSGETFSGFGALIVDEKVICEECTTLVDLFVADADSAEDNLVDKIADEGESDVRDWLVESGNWDKVPAGLWDRAVARAAVA